MTKFNVGDKVRFIGQRSEFNANITNGDTYTINEVDSDGWAFFYGDLGTSSSRSFITGKTEHLFELAEPTPVEASPTVIALLANLSRRLYEAEQTIKEQAYEINELYKAVAERG